MQCAEGGGHTDRKGLASVISRLRHGGVVIVDGCEAPGRRTAKTNLTVGSGVQLELCRLEPRHVLVGSRAEPHLNTSVQFEFPRVAICSLRVTRVSTLHV